MLPTPDISHLSSSDYEHVYEPAEDSFLFLDGLEKEMDFINSLKPCICMEIGSGSGIVCTFLAKQLKFPSFKICTDVNPRAATITRKTGSQNGVDLNCVLMDLAFSAAPRLAGKVDVVLFNPPYVVTPSSEVGSADIVASWAGGKRGREVTDKFWPLVNTLLSDNGVCYVIAIKENDIDEIGAIMKEYKMTMSIVISRRSGPEHLSLLKFTRS